MPDNIQSPEVKGNSSAWYDMPGVVYFISAGSCIKIGVTLNKRLLSRMRAIQSSNHELIRLIRIIPFDTMREADKREQEIHKLFKDIQRIKSWTAGHEWFDATEELLSFIKNEPKAIKPQDASPELISKTVLELFCSSSS